MLTFLSGIYILAPLFFTCLAMESNNDSNLNEREKLLQIIGGRILAPDDICHANISQIQSTISAALSARKDTILKNIDSLDLKTHFLLRVSAQKSNLTFENFITEYLLQEELFWEMAEKEQFKRSKSFDPNATPGMMALTKSHSVIIAHPTPQPPYRAIDYIRIPSRDMVGNDTISQSIERGMVCGDNGSQTPVTVNAITNLAAVKSSANSLADVITTSPLKYILSIPEDMSVAALQALMEVTNSSITSCITSM